MNTDANSALDGITQMLQIIGSDAALRQTFCRLASLSAGQRYIEIHKMAEQMAAEHKDPEFVGRFRLFADPRVFEAARLALRECQYIKD